MKHLNIVLSLAAAVAGATLPGPSASGLPLPLGEMGWTGSITPGGPVVQVWGADLDDIEAKIKKDHPEFSMYLDEPIQPLASSENPALEAREALSKRLNGNCDGRFGNAKVSGVNDGINSLRRVTAGCSARARTCIRTQCNHDAAIGLCNDNYHDITVRCTDVANMAEEIRKSCHWVKFPHVCPPGRPCTITDHWSHGQEFARAGPWNVIVGTCGFFGGGSRPV
ncbi:hypothetical protein B0T11DRAFT_300918 [Plectosphaerella cucumerina]|uniref:Uncharacterized protein n=1 Tax=Plectosphaerella cucumerina TaxID=40658 RepID=A0A8K0TCH6_9PEZI|nr:hypothetical protein B0T11DRAFT_300918 [Plectosphaerella cucumerina]